MKKMLSTLIITSLSLISLAQTDLKTTIDRILHADLYKGTAPGLSIGVIKDGKVLYSRGYGLANMEYSISNSDSSVFDIGSMAKQFTAACIWTLVHEGSLSLDDDIRKYLPEIPDFGATIRIRHMLNHTSGLRNYATILDMAGYDYTEHFFNNQSILELMSRQKGLNNTPGEKMIYGNTPFNLLSIIVERVSGMTFYDYANQHLFIPLGMTQTRYRVDNTSIVPNRAVGYITDSDTQFCQFPRIESCYGGGSLWSTVKDLTRWSNVLMHPEAPYKDLVAFLLTTDTFNNGQVSGYSRGLNMDMYRGYKTIHHGGMTKGYCSQMITVPALELSVILLANYNTIHPEPLSYKIIDLFIAKADDPQKHPVLYQHKHRQLKAFAGVYQERNSCLRMDIVFKNDTLWAKSSLGGHFIPLRSISPTCLCRQDNESVRYVFDQQTGSDLLVYFGATPFYFEQVTLADPSSISYEDYTGDYYSQELDVHYKVYTEGADLLLSYPNNPKVKLISGQQDEFGNGYRTRYSFYRNAQGIVNRLLLASEGSVKGIEFNRTKN